MPELNASGIVNERDSSDIGAAVIYPSSKETAIDYFVNLNDKLAEDQRRKDFAKEQQARQQSAKNADFNVASPLYQQALDEKYKGWQGQQSKSDNEKNPTLKYQYRQLANLTKQEALAGKAFADMNQKTLDRVMADINKNPELYDEEEKKRVLDFASRTDHKLTDMFVPPNQIVADQYDAMIKDLETKEMINDNVFEDAEGNIHNNKSIGYSAESIDQLVEKTKLDPRSKARMRQYKRTPNPDGTYPTDAEVEQVYDTRAHADIMANLGIAPSAPVKSLWKIGDNGKEYNTPYYETKTDKSFQRAPASEKKKEYSYSGTTMANDKYAFKAVEVDEPTYIHSVGGDLQSDTHPAIKSTDVMLSLVSQADNVILDLTGQDVNVYDPKTSQKLDVKSVSGKPQRYAVRFVNGEQTEGVIINLPQETETVSVTEESSTGKTTTSSKNVTKPIKSVFVTGGSALAKVQNEYGGLTRGQIVEQIKANGGQYRTAETGKTVKSSRQGSGSTTTGGKKKKKRPY